eukprot:TRINITY_DN1462_c0_g1_i9.p1 TRINITY_DN1462_c0_g1~~TRINITY_DN1462_c0_g1_i9.p1  ORF type:complete len:264 (+),score=71.62 TRINITY_DN1462_c0_g1_i9:111-794(+)
MAFVGSLGGGCLTTAPRSRAAASVCGRRSTAPAAVAVRMGASSPRADDPDTPDQPSPPGTEPKRSTPPPMPMVAVGDGQMDIYSRLAKDRILVLGAAVDDTVANQLVAQMLFLASEDPDKDITLWINSPGGSISAGLAIFDTMQFVPCDIQTICFGTAASMGAFLLGAGTKGKRKSLPNARIMIHQPLGGAQGQAADIEIQAGEILFMRGAPQLVHGWLHGRGRGED